MLNTISIIIGMAGYSLVAGVAIWWIGISWGNWLVSHARCAIYLGIASAAGSYLFTSLILIVSDIPNFSGPYVALSIRISGLLLGISLLTFTITYLKAKRE